MRLTAQLRLAHADSDCRAADLTACWTEEGRCYLAVVLDFASRRVVGWAVHGAPTTDLAIAALSLALPRLRLRRATKVLHHSDRGTQYASDRYRALLAAHRITPSMSRAGNCWDNAPVESFFSSLKAELLPERLRPTAAPVLLRFSVRLPSGGATGKWRERRRMARSLA